jgi:ubiquinone/menaquinone biosynthesis C-methylase UbiE
MIQPVKEQYASSRNLETRMGIYQYAVDPKPFSKWLSEQIHPEQHVHILELGSGTGSLWKDLKANFQDCQITLSDLSRGMLERSKENLGGQDFHYEIIDFHAIPYPANTFDILISNHNLYHAVDLNRALGEISRVLKDGGVFYSTTNSRQHLAELRELIHIPDDNLWPGSLLADAFGAETGLEILSTHFRSVERRISRNELRITELAPIVDYFMSVRDARVHQIVQGSMDQIRARFDAEIRRVGYYRVKSKGCLFICRK